MNLDRITLLLVEDNSFIRNTLEDLYRFLGLQRISTAHNGEEAIEFLKDHKRAGNPGPDIIVSDLVMAPINGLLLVRWVRTSPESPNRFVPFIMLSGAADREYVASARDLGATEFLAKPFSGASVYGKLAEVVEHPRQFVATGTYFGPDRRRRKSTPRGDGERRRPGDDFATIVYSADKAQRPKKDSTDVWLFRLTNYLHEKATGGAAKGPIQIPTALLEEAEKKLERAALDFADWAAEYLSRLSNLCAEAMMEPSKRSLQFEEINRLALELRGQGGTFGYPLISIFGKMLFENTREGCPLTDSQVEIVKAHIDAMRAVLREKIAGDGGQVGKEILAALKAAVKRHQVVE